MRTGVIKSNTIYGVITADDDQSEVYFNPPAVRPASYRPPRGQAVEFECFVGHNDWAKLVRQR